MSKEDNIRLNGEVVDVLPAATFKVRLENGVDILAYLSGKMRQNDIKIYLGDAVEIEMTPYDMSRGRIVYRQK
jgi:translation initiation factor IF-1